MENFDNLEFHDFFRIMRRHVNVTLEQVCEGLCSVSMMNRIESGERLPGKLMRDRILSRMGVQLEKYEDYLSAEEYGQWELRRKIIQSIERKNTNEAKQYLERYRGCGGENALKAQYCAAMELMLLQMQGDLPNVLAEIAERAVELTMPGKTIGLTNGRLLSAQELNLLIEYVQQHKYVGTFAEETAWKEKQYNDILHYMEHSCLDDACQAMVYPKAVFYLCELILQKHKTPQNIELGIKLCNQAMERLRNAGKSYYFVELTDVLEKLVKEFCDLFEGSSRQKEMEDLQADLKEKIGWRTLLMELYAEYNVEPYMKNFCYIYGGTENYCIGDVIRIRRQMLGLTREQLCENVCSVRTLVRVEQKRAKTQMPIIRELFARLGMNAEYIRARVISGDYEVLALAEQCSRHENNYDIEKWEPCMMELKQRLSMDIPQNKQFVMHSTCMMRFVNKELEKEKLVEKIIEAIEYTIPISCILKPGEKFLSQEEITCIRNIGIFAHTEKENPYIQAIREICEQEEKKSEWGICMRKYEYLMTSVISYLGNIGEYDTSNELSMKLMEKSLRHRRTGVLAEMLYNNLWNENQREKGQLMQSIRGKEVLGKCMALGKFNKNEKMIRFLERI